MSLPLIGSNQRITAELWNDLFSELDAKISRVMDNKNLLFLQWTSTLLSAHPTFFGNLFFFFNGDAVLRTPFAPAVSYDSHPFVTAAQTLALDTSNIFDAGNRIIALSAPVPDSYRNQVDMRNALRFFDRSLQCHTRSYNNATHYLIEPTDEGPSWRPEKRWRYAVAEIVIEGAGFDSFPMQSAWDKFNFFRFHNCNPYTVTVDFAGAHQVTIPRWESKCVRRDTTTSGYLDGYRYFWKFKPGDPRIFEMPRAWVGGVYDTPALSMGANNVVSPRVAYDYVGLFGAQSIFGPEMFDGIDSRGPRFYIDPHELNDISDLYAAHFPPVTPDTLIGDLLHHSGNLTMVRMNAQGAATQTTVEFFGYNDLKTRWPTEYGITATENPDGSLTLNRASTSLTLDLWAVGSNLVRKNNSAAPVAQLDNGYTLDNSKPDATILPIRRQVTNTPHSWTRTGEPLLDGSVPTLGPQTITTTETLKRYGTLTEDTFGRNLSLHGHKVSDVTNLGLWGANSLANQDTIDGTFEDRAVTLTPFGLTVKFTQRIPLNYSFNPNPLLANSLDLIEAANVDDHPAVELSGTALQYRKTIVFGGYGFPPLSAPAFIGPRKARLVADIPTTSPKSVAGTVNPSQLGQPIAHHPTVTHQPYAADGQDFALATLTAADKEAETTAAQALVPLALDLPGGFDPGFEYPFDFQVYLDPDVLQEFFAHGVSDYAARRARYLANTPAPRKMVRMNLLREHYNALANRVNAIKKCFPLTFQQSPDMVSLSSNTTGPFGGQYYPADMYAGGFQRDSDYWNLCRDLQIPIRTEADLPASYQALKNYSALFVSFTTPFSETYEYLSTEQVLIPLSGIFWRHRYMVQARLDPVTTMHTARRAENLITSQLFEGTHQDPTFYWIKVADVQAAAERLGFLFYLERVGIPHALEVFEYTSAQRIFDHVTATDQPRASELFNSSHEGRVGGLTQTFAQRPFSPEAPEFPGTFPAFVESVTGADAEWMRAAPGNAVRILDYPAGDTPILTDFRGNLLGYLLVNGIPRTQTPSSMPVDFMMLPAFNGTEAYTRRYLRRNTALTPKRNEFASAAHQSWLSPGLERNSKAVLTTRPSVAPAIAPFSPQARRNALARVQHGPGVIPLSAANPEPAARIVELNQQTNLIFGGSHAEHVLWFLDWPIMF